MQYKTLVFDFDLTLADTSKPIFTCYEHTLKVCGYPKQPRSEIFKMIGLDLVDGLRIISGETDDEKVEQMRKIYVAKADEVMTKETVLFDGAEDFLRTLRSSGIKYAIVSSKFRYRLLDAFRNLNLMDIAPDVVIGREDVDSPKPDPSGLIRAIEALGVDKSSTLYVGDSYIDAGTAQNADVDFAGVLTGPTTKEMFDKYKSVRIFENIKKFSEWIVADL